MKGSFGLLDMCQAICERNRIEVVVASGMGERLVDEKELNILRSVITIDGLQTGDIFSERRSRETPKNQNGILPSKAARLERFALRVKDRDLRQ